MSAGQSVLEIGVWGASPPMFVDNLKGSRVISILGITVWTDPLQYSDMVFCILGYLIKGVVFNRHSKLHQFTIFVVSVENDGATIGRFRVLLKSARVRG